jgi:hypothetical protein
MANTLINSGAHGIQAMPFVEGFIDLDNTADPIVCGGDIGPKLIMCKTEPAAISITFDSGEIAATTMTEGQARALPVGCTVTITSGTFDFA